MDDAAGGVPFTGQEGAGIRHTLIGKNVEPTPDWTSLGLHFPNTRPLSKSEVLI
jgi:hypothetical protein